MLSGDCQSQGLAEWLQTLGCPVPLTPADLRKLNTPKMRSVWRHLQAHVVPAHAADTLRKNVLLTRLKNENIFAGQFGSLKLDCVDQLNKAKVIFKLEEEIKKIKGEIKTVDEKMDNEKFTLLRRTAKEEYQNHSLLEIDDKTTILKLKHLRILRECEKLNIHKETAVCLKSSRAPISYNELNYQKSLVSKYVRNYKFSVTETEDDSEYLCEIIGSILEFKPDTILDGIVQNAKDALRTFNSKASIDISSNLIHKLNLNNILTFREHLSDLKVDIIKNELKIHECLQKISSELTELDKEKAALSKEFSYHNINEATADEVVDSVIRKRKSNKIHLIKEKLLPEDECKTIEAEVKWSVNYFGEEENELWKEVEKKVSEVNRVTSLIFSSVIDSEKINEILAQISQLATDFQIVIRQKYKENIISCEFSDMITKEIEVFQKIPMVSLHRRWGSSTEVLRVGSAKEISENSSLLYHLLQYEDKNFITNVLEKYCWSLSINPQFH